MDYGTVLITAPTIEPLTPVEVRKQVSVEGESHDAMLARLTTVARQQVEDRLNRQLVTATYDHHLDRFPFEGPIKLPRAPLQSVTSITYTDTTGTTQTVSTSVYKVVTSREPGEIWLKFGQIWPIAKFEPDVITIRFVAGFGATAALVPEKYKLPMLLMITDWFENRMGEGEVSETVNNLLMSCGYGDELAGYGVPYYAAQ